MIVMLSEAKHPFELLCTF